jgi:uncharacterized protein (DUF1778 family)
MMDLRVNDVERDLIARLKSKAALAGKTLRELVIEALRKAAK